MASMSGASVPGDLWRAPQSALELRDKVSGEALSCASSKHTWVA
jgi:hypothetical protein